MQRSTLYIDTPRRRLPSARVALAAAVAGLAIGGLWQGSADDDASPRTPAPAPRVTAPPSALRAGLPATPPIGTGLPAAAPTRPPALAPAAGAAPLSREVAPGVHVTPMGLPPGATVPQPAGPSPHDSEPEN